MASTDKRAFREAKAVRGELGLPLDQEIDPFNVAATIGLSVVRVPLGKDHPVDGAYARRDSKGFILVNTTTGYRRQRFTCAHELGHHFLIEDADDVEVIEDFARMINKADPHERSASLFASELLMPDAGVRTLVAGTDEAEACVGAVARTYNVSPHAAAIRLSELEILDDATCKAVIKESLDNWQAFWKRQRIPSDNKKRVGETELPNDYVERAKRLHEAGILADDRFAELVSRDLPVGD